MIHTIDQQQIITGITSGMPIIQTRAAFSGPSGPRPGLILRVKEDTDSDIPSARSVAALNLLRLACLTGQKDLRHMADTTTRPSKG